MLAQQVSQVRIYSPVGTGTRVHETGTEHVCFSSVGVFHPFRGRATLCNYAVFLCVFQPLGRAAWAECTCAQAQGAILFSELVFE